MCGYFKGGVEITGLGRIRGEKLRRCVDVAGRTWGLRVAGSGTGGAVK